MDVGQPYTCEAWGDMGEEGIPMIIHTNVENSYYFSSLWSWSETNFLFDHAVLLNHEMEYSYSIVASSTYLLQLKINELLDEFQNSLYPGDLNNDEIIDILDIIITVNMIMSNEYSATADLNDDSVVNILDIINLVNIIMDTRGFDAESAMLTIEHNELKLNADGAISGVQLTLSHEIGAIFELSDNVIYSDHYTNETETIIIMVAPENGKLFTSSHNFEIVNAIVANSKGEIPIEQPHRFSMTAAYPNPFNPSTQFNINLDKSQYLQIDVLNIMGQKIDHLYSGMLNDGSHTFKWSASNIANGTYFIQVIGDDILESQKVVLLK